MNNMKPFAGEASTNCRFSILLIKRNDNVKNSTISKTKFHEKKKE